MMIVLKGKTVKRQPRTIPLYDQSETCDLRDAEKANDQAAPQHRDRIEYSSIRDLRRRPCFGTSRGFGSGLVAKKLLRTIVPGRSTSVVRLALSVV